MTRDQPLPSVAALKGTRLKELEIGEFWLSFWPRSFRIHPIPFMRLSGFSDVFVSNRSV